MKKETLPIIKISQLSQAIRNTNPFADELVLWEIENGRDIPENEAEAPLPMRLNGLLILLITDGSVKLSIDYVHYEVRADNLVFIMPDHITQFHSRSENMKGKVIVVARSFIETALMSKNPPPMFQYMYLRKNPCTGIDKNDVRQLEHAFLYLKEKQTDKKRRFHREILQNALLGYLLELGDILCDRQEMTPPQLSRKEELFEQFLRLLHEHGKVEHRVTFYADKLFITSQYLSSILKELSGKPANKWIEDTLIMEAKLLLKAPQATVQQVADTLHFSDQSTFGKFFKKHVGMSPSEFRKS